MKTSEEVVKILDWANSNKALRLATSPDGTDHFQIAVGQEEIARQLAGRIKNLEPHVAEQNGKWRIEFPLEAAIVLLPDNHNLRSAEKIQALPKRQSIRAETALDSVRKIIALKDASGDIIRLETGAGKPAELALRYFRTAPGLADDMVKNLEELGVSARLEQTPGNLLVAFAPEALEKAKLLPDGVSAETITRYCGTPIREMFLQAIQDDRMTCNEVGTGVGLNTANALQIIAPTEAFEHGDSEAWLKYLQSKLLAIAPSPLHTNVRESGTQGGQMILQMHVSDAAKLELLPTGITPENITDELPKKLGKVKGEPKAGENDPRGNLKAIIEEANGDGKVSFAFDGHSRGMIKLHPQDTAAAEEMREALTTCGIRFTTKASRAVGGEATALRPVIEFLWGKALDTGVIPKSMGTDFPSNLIERDSGEFRSL